MSVQDTVFNKKIRQLFNTTSVPMVMGILNVSPDSFFDGGNYLHEKDWLLQTEKLILEGAEIIDIGACSTRPGASKLTEKEETDRLLKVIESVRSSFPDILISVDTFRASIAQKAVQLGATIINDISGGTMDANMFATVANLNVTYILMHIQGIPETMQLNPIYNNVTEEVFQFLQSQLQTLKTLGCSNIIIDPGFGFGKTLEHNYQLLNQLEKFNSLGYPLLVGFSRKSMINKLLKINANKALNGTTVLNTIALMKGAKIIRVHDANEAKEAVTICDYLKQVDSIL